MNIYRTKSEVYEKDEALCADLPPTLQFEYDEIPLKPCEKPCFFARFVDGLVSVTGLAMATGSEHINSSLQSVYL